MDYKKIFNLLKPRFFQSNEISSLPENYILTEMVMDFNTTDLSKIHLQYPQEITFGFYDGDITALHTTIKKVDEDWAHFFLDKDKIFCAYDGNTIASFCIIDDIGNVEGLRIGGPGCVGTVPEYRHKGIGLELVRRATEILHKQSFDISWIHWTHLEKWYERLGYKTVLRWNNKGFID